MAFWVYSDDTGYAKVHRAACSFCNDGSGIHGVRSPSTAAWLRFETYADARRGAVATGHAVSECGHCQPGT